MTTKKIRLLIVDDHPIVTEGLRLILQDQPEIVIANHALNGAKAMSLLKEEQFDVVLLDISLPDMSGVDLCKHIKKEHQHIKVLVLSTFNDRSVILQMIQSGAMGYLFKNTQSEELIKAIKLVNDKLFYLGEDVQKTMSEYAADEEEIPVLTRREKEILLHIADGLITSVIAEKLFISPLTVETHRRNLMQKFNVSNSPALIKKAMNLKLI
jgi:DNA-binding NarL/FixJ family response regulator